MRIWQMDEVDQYLSILDSAPLAKKSLPGKRKGRRTFINLPAAFDIETTTAPDQTKNWMWIWQWAIGDQVIVGRTWAQYREFIAKLKTLLDGKWLIVWVHNLGYEWQYISSFQHFGPESVIAPDSRSVLTATDECLEYRCSYLYSGYSLKAWGEKLHAGEQKRKPINYDAIRYPDTPLTSEELDYAVGDVLTQTACLKICAERDGCDYCRLPYTNTGYVRREIKALRMKYWDVRSSYDCYKYLAAAFRGGNTHASRFPCRTLTGRNLVL